MNTKNIKDLLISRNTICHLDKNLISAIEEALYEEDTVKCVDAVHVDYENEESQPYTWFIPAYMNIEINEGDTLVVERVVGNGLAIVKAVTGIYEKTKNQHEYDLHPYCPVITNLGKRL